MKMAMVEFHADTCDVPHQSSDEILERPVGFSIGTVRYESIVEAETVEVSRSKFAFIDSETTEYCRLEYNFGFPKKLWRLITNT
jgi:hypothetical protein